MSFDFKRPKVTRVFKKKVFVACEGSKTEPAYLSVLKKNLDHIELDVVPRDNKSSPKDVLKSIKGYLKNQSLPQNQEWEAWIVIDHDGRGESEFLSIYDWIKESSRNKLAISDPNFEYWLLLHCEPGRGLSSVQDLKSRLVKNIPDYNKEMPRKFITEDRVKKAIMHAENRQQCSSFKTDMYKLVRSLDY